MTERRRRTPGARRRTASGASAAHVSTKGRRAPAPRARTGPRYHLRLYVTGTTWASAQAIERMRSLCEHHLRGRYVLDVIDIYQLPALAKDEQIVATPTLVRVLPAPLRRFIGNLSSVEKVLFGLDLRGNEP